jgi:hypothetical protein
MMEDEEVRVQVNRNWCQSVSPKTGAKCDLYAMHNSATHKSKHLQEDWYYEGEYVSVLRGDHGCIKVPRYSFWERLLHGDDYNPAHWLQWALDLKVELEGLESWDLDVNDNSVGDMEFYWRVH